MKIAEALRDRLKAQISELQSQLAGVEMTIRAMRGDAEPTKRSRAPRSNVKQYILTLLEEAKHNGVNAASAVEMAEKKGDTLERGTVSSLLSRLKSEGTVTYRDGLYRLTPYSKESNSADAAAAFH